MYDISRPARQAIFCAACCGPGVFIRIFSHHSMAFSQTKALFPISDLVETVSKARNPIPWVWNQFCHQVTDSSRQFIFYITPASA